LQQRLRKGRGGYWQIFSGGGRCLPLGDMDWNGHIGWQVLLAESA